MKHRCAQKNGEGKGQRQEVESYQKREYNYRTTQCIYYIANQVCQY